MEAVPTRVVIAAYEAEFARYRGLSERAVAQLGFQQLRVQLDAQTNSICVIMKHVGGNLRSRWTEPFSSDGEKPWRDRDSEFIDDFADRESLMAAWNAGWAVIEDVLASCNDSDLPRVLSIRGEPHTLALALARSLSHTAYHSGQIVQIARIIASRDGVDWKTLTVERGGSKAYNARMGFGSGKKDE